MRKRYIPCLCKARALLEALPTSRGKFSLQEGHVPLTENRTRQHIQQSLKIFYHYPRAKFQKNHTRILCREVLILFWTNCAHWYAHHCRTVRLFCRQHLQKKPYTIFSSGTKPHFILKTSDVQTATSTKLDRNKSLCFTFTEIRLSWHKPDFAEQIF